jgi:hypothetical protein
VATLIVNITVNNPTSSKFITASVTENNLVAGNSTSTATITIVNHGVDLSKLALNVTGTNLVAGARSGNTFPITCGTAVAGLHEISITSSEEDVDDLNMSISVISPAAKYITAVISNNSLVAGNASSTATIAVTQHGSITADTLSLNVGSTGLLGGARDG